jgi:hypothetical protein
MPITTLIMANLSPLDKSFHLASIPTPTSPTSVARPSPESYHASGIRYQASRSCLNSDDADDLDKLA